MKVILVTSQTTYVKDNYYSLLKQILDNVLPGKDIEIVALILIKTVSFSLFLKVISLMIAGVFRVSSILLLNIFKVLFNDKRLSMFKSLNIPVYTFKNINYPKTVEFIKTMNPDLIVNMRTRNIYKRDILNIARIGCLNIHHGILPENRGTMCDLWSFFEGRPVGFSIHWMNEKIDDGEILTVKEIDTGGVKSYADIPMLSSLEEANSLLWCFDKIKTDRRFYSFKNTKENIRFTRNPTYKEIRQMIRKGIKL